MRGKWIFIAFACALGTMAAFFKFHWVAISACILYLVWVVLKDNQHLKLFIICIVTMSSFVLLFKWTDDDNVTGLTGNETEFKGVIETIPLIDGDRLTFIYQLPTKEKFNVTYRIKSIEEKKKLQQLQVGMSCKLTGKLTTPNKARNFFAFDYQKFLYNKRIHWIFTPDTLKSSQCTPTTSIKYLLQKWRAAQLSYIKEHFPENTIGFVQALIFGERSEMSQTTEDYYQRFGIVHLLAISGSHVVLIVAAAFLILVRLGVTREKTFLLLMILLPLYMIVAGGAPSVVRACLTAFLVLAATQMKLKFHPLDVLSIVFIGMILRNPYYITDIGFQLSFLVSFSLIISSSAIITMHRNYWQQLFVITVIAQICSFPLVLLYNFELTLLSLPLNVIFVPLICLIVLPLSIFSFFLHYLSETIAVIPISILSAIIDFSETILEQTNKLSSFMLTFGKPAGWFLISYYVVIIFFFISWEEHKQFVKAKKALFLLFSVFVYHWFAPYFSNEGKITMIDVGQGDSILIELPYRKAVYLIDTGGNINFFEKKEWQERKNSFEVGEDIVTPFLKAKGIRKIDKLILTHGDMDHIGGVPAVIEHFKVKETIVGVGSFDKSESEEVMKIYKAIAKNNVKMKEVKAFDFWKKDGMTFYILGPTGNEKSKNNQSVILYAKIGGKSWLFTGDLEREGENKVLEQFPNLKVDVIKIGHHGSHTSTSEAFIAQLSPTHALISAGVTNRFGHPHRDVIEILREHQVDILRTDEKGAICYIFTGNRGTFEWRLP
ncbi:MAG TPA: DNA internalization-related competence protein ComEC/Rec2 [Bacillus bacterium]|nr:DNA internalization-related competence protein ComEC/Rec2 [Bacillus sp. (in: firmicutes)]